MEQTSYFAFLKSVSQKHELSTNEMVSWQMLCINSLHTKDSPGQWSVGPELTTFALSSFQSYNKVPREPRRRASPLEKQSWISV
jgi:hypothetical protein